VVFFGWWGWFGFGGVQFGWVGVGPEKLLAFGYDSSPCNLIIQINIELLILGHHCQQELTDVI
jgi:hypothetical protein